MPRRNRITEKPGLEVVDDYRAGGPVLEDGPVEQRPFRRKIEGNRLPSLPDPPPRTGAAAAYGDRLLDGKGANRASAETYMSPRVTDPTSRPGSRLKESYAPATGA